MIVASGRRGNSQLGSSFILLSRKRLFDLTVVLIVSAALTAWAAVGGSISGTVKDPSRGVIPGVMLTATNTALGTNFKAMTDARGYYSYPSLPVGRYDLTIECNGFRTLKKTSLPVDSDSALELNTTLELASVSTEVSV